jgi:glutamate/tyrosine decarboxylase-like PLP-dependent enzyme
MTAPTAFPETGQSARDVLAALDDFRARDLKSDGRSFAFVYDAGEELRDLQERAFVACMGPNGLDPTVYPSARKIENHVVAACLELLRAPAGAVGTATAGGTESVILAVKTARDYARASGRLASGQRGKLLLPVTAHACFHKAAHYLELDIVPVDVDPKTFRADVEDARGKMGPDVVLVVGSAPSYAHGVVDPIPELAALAAEHGTLMHVDACVGGFVLPFLREIGANDRPFDFTVEGVTSISLDLHKYGFAPKGISILLQRRRELRDAQYFACANWTGYSIVNSTTLGSKSVAAMGAAFALMNHLGRAGYRERVRLMWEATQKVVATIESIDGLRLVTRPDINMIAMTTIDGRDLFELSDRMAEHGWRLQPTYSFGPSPAHIHLTIEPGNAHRIDAFLSDLRTAAADLPAAQPPPPGLIPMIEAMVASGGAADPAMLLAQLGISDGELPKRAAAIHRLLDAASPRLRERLLILFFGGLFS